MSGDPEHCLAVAAELSRAATATAREADRLRAVRQAVPSWTGRAAEAWSATALGHARAAEGLADRLHRTATALSAHGHGLLALQARARALTAEAAFAPLEMDDEGRLARPVPPPGLVPGSFLEAVWPERQRRLEHQREELAARVQALRADEAELHDRLVRVLTAPGARSATADPSSPGLLSWWDAPPVLAEGAAGVLRGSGSATLAVVGRGLSGALPPAGMAYGVAVETGANDRSLAYAVERTATTTALGTAAAALTATAATGVLAPLAAGVGAGLLAGMAYDALRAPTGDRRLVTAPPAGRVLRPDQVRPDQVRPDQVRPDQVRCAPPATSARPAPRPAPGARPTTPGERSRLPRPPAPPGADDRVTR